MPHEGSPAPQGLLRYAVVAPNGEPPVLKKSLSFLPSETLVQVLRRCNATLCSSPAHSEKVRNEDPP